MGTPKRRQNGFQGRFLDDQFQLPFLHAFDAAGFSEKRVCAVERAELAGAFGLPAAAIIRAEAARPGFEEGLFDGFDVGVRRRGPV